MTESSIAARRGPECRRTADSLPAPSRLSSAPRLRSPEGQLFKKVFDGYLCSGLAAVRRLQQRRYHAFERVTSSTHRAKALGKSDFDRRRHDEKGAVYECGATELRRTSGIAPGEKAYPIAATVFAQMHKSAARRRTAAVLDFFRWSLESGSTTASQLGYVPLTGADQPDRGLLGQRLRLARVVSEG